MNLKKRLSEIKEELKQLRGSIATAKDEELDGIQEKITALESEKRSVEQKIKLMAQAQRAAMTIEDEDDEEEEDGAEDQEDDDEGNTAQRGSIISIAKQRQKSSKAEQAKQARAKRGEELKQGRTVVLDATVLIPKKQSSELTPFPFSQVSSIIDAVKYTDVLNGETYDSPYIVSNGEGAYTDQVASGGTGGKYHETNPTWDKATISKTKITAYGEITKELERTPVANYAGAVEQNITISLRKKLAKEIVMGDGGTGHFTGIFSGTLKEKNTVKDYKLGVINENTLDEVVLNYGGDEDVESVMSLLLNKLTLLEFSRVRGSDKRKVYNINYEAGTIDGIKYFTSSAVKSFAAATAGTEGSDNGRGDPFMAYGDFNQYEVAVFSNIETAKSTDFKFDQGITCYRGDVYMGGNVVGYAAFMRVYKGASTVTQLTAISGAGVMNMAMKGAPSLSK